MVSSKYLLRFIRLLTALGSGAALLGAAILSLGALSATTETTGADPQFRVITVEAALPISDTAPGKGIARTIYFNNDKAGGVLTLTFNISGTPTLTLTCGSGFDQTTERVYMSSDGPWSPAITYSVASVHTSQDLAFTATNTNSVTTTLVLTFTQDITAPVIFMTDTLSTVLSTADLPTYTISGRVTDQQAGVQTVHVLTGAGGAWQVATLNGNEWLWGWTLPKEDWVPHTLTICATDYVSNTDTVTGTTYVDTVPPINPDSLTSTVPTNAWGAWVNLPVTWTAGSDGSTVISYAYALTTTWPYSVGLSDPVTTVQAITLPLDSDGVYTFYLRTRDWAMNLATDTISSGAFLRDATPPYTGSVTINEGAEFVTGTIVTLTLFSDDAGSGVAEMCLSNLDACTSWESYEISKPKWPLSDPDGPRTVCAWFRDEVQNRSAPYTDTIFLDRRPPVVHVTVTQKNINQLLVDWSDSYDPWPGSGIKAFEVYTRSDDSPWTLWLPITTATQSVFEVPHLGVTYTFGVTAFDRAGNQGQGSVQAFVPPCLLYLPLVMKNYQPFVNGDFEQGNLGWKLVDQGLPAQLISSHVEGTGPERIPLGNNCVLLGDKDFLCNSTGVPVGYAAVEQTFAVPSTTVPISLTFKYVIYTWDASPSDTYDRFEVYVVTDSSEELKLWDGNQNSTSLSCDKRWRVPGPDNPRDGKQSGWATGEVDLGPYKGQMVTISFRNYNRFDGWYNTYTYLDDVRLAIRP